jgi:hypothetical protein
MNTTATAQVSVPTAPKTCECGDYVNAETGARIACQRSTTRAFAPGHDAKLKGFLIRTGAQGHKVHAIDAEGNVTVLTAVQAADRYGFGWMVAKGIKAAGDREFSQTLRQVRKDAKKTHETPKEVSCKVGRWVYEGKIVDSPMHGEQFTYTNKQGVQVTTTKFTRV